MKPIQNDKLLNKNFKIMRKIKNTRKFDLPQIEFVINPPRLEKNKYSTKALITNLKNRGLHQIIDEVFPQKINLENQRDLVFSMEEWIINDIELVKNNQLFGDERLLNKIFHSIQIWGGNEARLFYFQDPVKNNFDVIKYGQAAKYLQSGEIQKALLIFQQFSQMGIAFASKHFSFWTKSLQGFKNEGARQLPILDKLIFQLTYGDNSPNFRHYIKYLEDIYLSLESQGIDRLTVHSLERQLFNFADTEEGKSWIKNKIESYKKMKIII